MSGMAIWSSSYGSTCVMAPTRLPLAAAFTRHFASHTGETRLSKADNTSLWFLLTADHANCVLNRQVGRCGVLRVRKQYLPANSLWETLAIN